MSNLDRYFENLADMQARLERGERTFLSFEPASKTLQRYMHGMMRGDYILLTAGTGVGKSMIARQLFLRLPLRYMPNIRPVIFYNSMEENYGHIISSLIQSYIYATYDGYVIPRSRLKGKTEKPFPKEELDMIMEARRMIEQFIVPNVHIVNHNNPGNFLRFMYKKMMDLGTFYKKNARGTAVEVQYPWEADSFDYFLPDDPNLWIIVISDHIALYTAGSRKYDVIERWATESLNTLSLKVGAIVVNIQQQSMDTEKAQYTMRGRAKGKHAPSLGNLGDYRATARNATLAIGLFDPLKYKIRSHEIFNGRNHLIYDTSELRGFYRSLHLLKHRDGMAQVQIPCFFNPYMEALEELPPHSYDASEYLKKVHQNGEDNGYSAR